MSSKYIQQETSCPGNPPLDLSHWNPSKGLLALCLAVSQMLVQNRMPLLEIIFLKKRLNSISRWHNVWERVTTILKCKKVLETIQLYFKNLQSYKYVKRVKIFRHHYHPQKTMFWGRWIYPLRFFSLSFVHDVCYVSKDRDQVSLAWSVMHYPPLSFLPIFHLPLCLCLFL